MLCKENEVNGRKKKHHNPIKHKNNDTFITKKRRRGKKDRRQYPPADWSATREEGKIFNIVQQIQRWVDKRNTSALKTMKEETANLFVEESSQTFTMSFWFSRERSDVGSKRFFSLHHVGRALLRSLSVALRCSRVLWVSQVVELEVTRDGITTLISLNHSFDVLKQGNSWGNVKRQLWLFLIGEGFYCICVDVVSGARHSVVAGVQYWYHISLDVGRLFNQLTHTLNPLPLLVTHLLLTSQCKQTKFLAKTWERVDGQSSQGLFLFLFFFLIFGLFSARKDKGKDFIERELGLFWGQSVRKLTAKTNLDEADKSFLLKVTAHGLFC